MNSTKRGIRTRRPLWCCSYVGCESKEGNANITLFQFPKDPVRRLRWLAVANPDDQLQPDTPKYMCDLHFSRDFLSLNSRRKQLVGEAVPFVKVHYSEDPAVNYDEEVMVANNISEMFVNQSILGGVDDDDDDDAATEDPSVVDPYEGDRDKMVVLEIISNDDDDGAGDGDENQLNDCLDNCLNDEDTGGKDQVTFPAKTEQEENCSNENLDSTRQPKSIKRRITDDSDDSTTKKKICQQKSRSIFVKSRKIVEEEPAPPILRPEITQFIFNGMEYVQMPKSIYIADMEKLKSELNVYKRTIDMVKQQLSLLDDLNANE